MGQPDTLYGFGVLFFQAFAFGEQKFLYPTFSCFLSRVATIVNNSQEKTSP